MNGPEALRFIHVKKEPVVLQGEETSLPSQEHSQKKAVKQVQGQCE